MLTETLNAQGGTGSTTTNENNNYASFKREPVDGSPFTILWEENKGYYMVMGDYRMTNEFETKKELEKFVEKEKWNIMLIMNSIVTAKLIEDNNNLQNKK